MRQAIWSVLSLLVCVAGCSASGTASSGPGSEKAVAIKSTDFAILPCRASSASAPCAMVAAGGKRILLGTPAGIGSAFEGSDLRELDAVLLFSLRAADLEGLDEVRNAAWVAGHEGSLAVAGPSGTSATVAALNAAFEVSDSLTFVEAPPAGGFSAALLRVLPGEGDAKVRVFDSGDLVVTKIENAQGRAGYWFDYAGKRAVVQPCVMDQAVRFAPDADFVLSCDGGQANWPIGDVQFVVKGPDPDM